MQYIFNRSCSIYSLFQGYVLAVGGHAFNNKYERTYKSATAHIICIKNSCRKAHKKLFDKIKSMYTHKKNILQLAALLRAHGIRRIVLCPGSRDIPLVQTFAHIPDFVCYPMTDERSAGFFAIGLALHDNTTVAVCCTSGSALLNLHPAISEAYYQQVPLVVISADRPAAWIGQMDGQTLPQPGVFGTLVKKSVNLPDIQTDEDEWFCNRLINEALLETCHHGKGPVHINVPVSEPFFQFPVTQLPDVRVISRYQGWNNQLADRLRQYTRRMVVAGQMNRRQTFTPEQYTTLYKHFAWIVENINNPTLPEQAITHIDQLLYSMDNSAQETMCPELLITYGGHIISKRLKKFLRQHPPMEHWHISADGNIVDLFGSLSTVIEIEPHAFWQQVVQLQNLPGSDYPQTWRAKVQNLGHAIFAYSQMKAIGEVIRRLPNPCTLHLANSSTVRYAQLFDLPTGVEVQSNRGVNGIEGSLSTAIGYASVSNQLNFILIGDLSFFYDMNALWNPNYRNNVRILLLNNEGGEIFHALPGLSLDEHTHHFVIGTHHASGKAWAEDRGFDYLCTHNDTELQTALDVFTQPNPTPHPLLLEVFTDKTHDTDLLKAYYHKLKQ